MKPGSHCKILPRAYWFPAKAWDTVNVEPGMLDIVLRVIELHCASHNIVLVCGVFGRQRWDGWILCTKCWISLCALYLVTGNLKGVWFLSKSSRRMVTKRRICSMENVGKNTMWSPGACEKQKKWSVLVTTHLKRGWVYKLKAFSITLKGLGSTCYLSTCLMLNMYILS